MRAVVVFLRRQGRLTFLVAALAIATALLVLPLGDGAQNSHDGGADAPGLEWVDGDRALRITASEFRPRSPTRVRVGDEPWVEARADATGTVRLEVSGAIATAGEPGSSVIVSGRGANGASRVLVSAVPPRATARGPLDLLPWVTAGALLLAIAVMAARRVRRAYRPISP
jgi:hypothetical protein